MVNANNVMGSPVGVTIADNIKMNINVKNIIIDSSVIAVSLKIFLSYLQQYFF